jgi:plastocyanin
VNDRAANRENLLLPILLPVGALVVIGLVLFGFSRILLGISHTAATVVALITATAVVGVAAYAASRERLTGAALFPMVGAIAGVALLAGGVAIVAVGPQTEGEGEGITVALTAPEGAAAKGFEPTSLSFQKDTPTSLAFDNQDPSVQHNVVIFEGEDTSAAPVFEGELVTGPQKFTYAVPGLPEGAYVFHCAVHPSTMTGTIDVAAGPLSIVAQNLQFSTDRLEVPADTPTPLAFDNQDAGTPHNFDLFKDAGYTQDLFKGDLVTGPAQTTYNLPPLPPGTYYFRCDVHPTTMTGQLVATGGEKGGPGGGSGEGAGSPPPQPPTPSSG